MGDVEVTVEVQANGLGAPGSFGAQFEIYLVWAITPAGKTFKLGALEATGNHRPVEPAPFTRTRRLVWSDFRKEISPPASGALGGHLVRRWGALLHHLCLPHLGHQA
jgi:hypothetical protein